MNKAIPTITVVLVIGLVVLAIYQALEKQNKKINSLALGLGQIQDHADQNQLATQVALQEVHNLSNKIEQTEEKPSKDFIWASKPEPIAISTAD